MIILEHLKERGVNSDAGITLGEGVAYFWLYNLQGQIVGYQRYNPDGTKTSSPTIHPRDKKYYVWLSDAYFTKGFKAALWGWQFYNKNAKYIMLVEGIFDAYKAINAGMVCFATLGNDPKLIKQQLWLLAKTHIIITCSDNDAAGNVLKKYGSQNIIVPPTYKDLGETPQLEVNTLLKTFST